MCLLSYALLCTGLKKSHLWSRTSFEVGLWSGDTAALKNLQIEAVQRYWLEHIRTLYRVNFLVFSWKTVAALEVAAPTAAWYSFGRHLTLSTWCARSARWWPGSGKQCNKSGTSGRFSRGNSYGPTLFKAGGVMNGRRSWPLAFTSGCPRMPDFVLYLSHDSLDTAFPLYNLGLLPSTGTTAWQHYSKQTAWLSVFRMHLPNSKIPVFGFVQGQRSDFVKYHAQWWTQCVACSQNV